MGSRSRGLLVDITNYVMLEVGEPMHAFDRRQIDGERILVREATAGERITTLDHRDIELVEGDLLIADSQRSLALAGIMGGANSMVQDDTSTIVLEAAIFAPERIRGTRLRLGAGTDSSSRFEGFGSRRCRGGDQPRHPTAAGHPARSHGERALPRRYANHATPEPEP